jgi:hypothetical protein
LYLGQILYFVILLFFMFITVTRTTITLKYNIMKKILLTAMATVFYMAISYGQGGNWEWARLFDTIGNINPESFHMRMQTDDNDNIYIMGVFRNYNVKIGTETLVNRGNYDIFLCSFDPVGNFRWARAIGSSGSDDIAGMVIDGSNLYVAGAYRSEVYFTEMETLPNDNHYDSFIALYSTSNGEFQSAKRLFWGQDPQRFKDVTLDEANDYLVVAGQFKTHLVYNDGVQDDTITAQSSKDHFIARFDMSSGFENLQFNDLKTFYGDQDGSIFNNVSNSVIGTSHTGYFITGDCFGHIWITENDSLIVTGATGTSSDFMIIKLDNNLDYLWARRGGNSNNEHANSANSDNNGNIYITGKYEGDITVDSTATLQSSIKHGFVAQDLYLAKYNREGRLLWFRTYGGNWNDDAFGLALTSQYVQVGGNVGNLGTTNTGFLRYDINGSYINRGEIFGDGDDIGKDVAFDSQGNTFIIGYFDSDTLYFGDEDDPDTILVNNTGTFDGFAGKYQYPLTIVREQVTNVSCNGGDNGYIKLRGEFGVPPYSWSWEHEANTTPIADTLVAGKYIVTLTDSDVPANVVKDSITITQPGVLIINRVITNVSCFSGTNGAIDITPSGGTTPYTYFWSGGTGLNPTQQDQTGLRADTYNVRLTDKKGCFLDSSFTVKQPPVLVIDSLVKWDISSCGLSDGAAKVYVSGGTPGYSYLWSNAETTDSISDLVKGSYSVQVTDIKGCKKTSSLISIFDLCEVNLSVVNATDVACYDSATGVIQLTTQGGIRPYTYYWTPDVGHNDSIATGLVAGTYKIVVEDSDSPANKDSIEVPITQPSQLFASAIRTDVICYGDATGEINLLVSGGTPPYSYEWSNGSNEEDQTGLVADNYDVLITDNNGCELFKEYPIFQNTEIRITNETITDLNCYQENIGSIDIDVTGGVPPRSYYWLEENWNPNDGLTTQDITDLFAGQYEVTITDDSGCVKIDTFMVNEPEELFVLEDSVKPSCIGFDNGEGWVIGQGGTQPYTFTWAPSGKTGDHVTNMVPTSYVVKVVDSKFCTNTTTVTIAESPAITIQLDTIHVVLCQGYDSGAVYTTPGGGTPPLYCQWDDPNFTTDCDLINVPGGDYRLTVTDAAGCAKLSDPYTVEDLSTAIVYQVDNVGHLSCFGDTDGSIQLSEISGNTPFAFSADSGMTYQAAAEFTGLLAGNYYIFVKDANGCINVPDTAVSITEPDAISIGYVTTPVSCFEGDDGIITVTPAGGTPDYTYLWNNDETTPEITGLMAGTYTVTVTDANDCSLDSIIQLGELPRLVFVSILIDSASSETTADGEITIEVEGGSPLYSISNGIDVEIGNNVNFDELFPTEYIITVTDAKSCQIDSTVTLPFKTGIFDLNYFSGIAIYPNPTTGKLTVEIENPEARDMVMEIINLQGQLIMKRELEYNGQPRFIETIDLGDVKGTYFMRVDGLPVNTKIIVK